jgi:hypothetical protein
MRHKILPFYTLTYSCNELLVHRTSIYVVYVLSSVLWCPLRFPHESDVRFVFTSSLFVGGCMSYLPYLYLFAYSGVQHILRCVCFFPSCCQFLSNVYFDCPFCIQLSSPANFHLKMQVKINNTGLQVALNFLYFL